MKDKEHFSIFEIPDATRFFAWLALSAAIFFGAYSVKVKSQYDKAVSGKSAVEQSERELKYQLELAGLKMKESATTIVWANTEINRLRENNDRIQQKVSNIRKLFYSAVKKNKEEELAVVAPKAVTVKENVAIAEEEFGDEFGDEVLFPRITEQVALSEKKIEELVNKSTELKTAAKYVAEILTYNPVSKKVFINLGESNAEVQEGNRFSVSRDGRHVTDIRVAKVHSVTSTCEVISPLRFGLKTGDKVERIVAQAF